MICFSGSRAQITASEFAAAMAYAAELAFAGPPWHESRGQAWQMIGRMAADAQRSGFVLAIAFAGHGTRVAGFGYGVDRECGDWTCARSFSEPAPFEFCELAVRPERHGEGIGRTLHDAVLRETGPRSRWLTTHPAARPAMNLYRNRGWRTSQLYPSRADGSPRVLMTRQS